MLGWQVRKFSQKSKEANELLISILALLQPCDSFVYCYSECVNSIVSMSIHIHICCLHIISFFFYLSHLQLRLYWVFPVFIYNHSCFVLKWVRIWMHDVESTNTKICIFQPPFVCLNQHFEVLFLLHVVSQKNCSTWKSYQLFQFTETLMMTLNIILGF